MYKRQDDRAEGSVRGKEEGIIVRIAIFLSGARATCTYNLYKLSGGPRCLGVSARPRHLRERVPPTTFAIAAFRFRGLGTPDESGAPNGAVAAHREKWRRRRLSKRGPRLPPCHRRARDLLLFCSVALVNDYFIFHGSLSGTRGDATRCPSVSFSRVVLVPRRRGSREKNTSLHNGTFVRIIGPRPSSPLLPLLSDIDATIVFYAAERATALHSPRNAARRLPNA